MEVLQKSVYSESGEIFTIPYVCIIFQEGVRAGTRSNGSHQTVHRPSEQGELRELQEEHRFRQESIPRKKER